MKTTETRLELIPFNELMATTTHPFDMGFLSDSVSKVVSVKKKLNTLYLSLNTGGTSLPPTFNVMGVGNIIDKLMKRIGAKKSPIEIELTLLSDKGVEWLNKVNSIVKETKNKENRIVTAGIVEGIEIDDMLEDLMKYLDESELLYED